MSVSDIRECAFLNAHRLFTKTDSHIRWQITFHIVKILERIFSDHSTIRLEINF